MSQPAVEFDPYRKWLGIPPQEQPAHYYRLLGVPLFETDPDVIENAADRQMSHVRTFQAGKFGKYTQTVLNELAAAKVCLLSPDRKAQYDAELKEKLQAEADQAHLAEPPPPPVTGQEPPGLEEPPVAISNAPPATAFPSVPDPAPLFQPTPAPAPVFQAPPTYEPSAFTAPVREAPPFAPTSPTNFTPAAPTGFGPAAPTTATPAAPVAVPLSVPRVAAPVAVPLGAPANVRSGTTASRARRGNSNRQFPLIPIVVGGIALLLLAILIALGSSSGKPSEKPRNSRSAEKSSSRIAKENNPSREPAKETESAKPSAIPDGSSTLPAFEPSKPLEPSRAEKLKEALAAARTAISNRDISLAKAAIQQADDLKQDADESADVEHLRSLMLSVERMLDRAVANAKTLKVGDVLKLETARNYSIKVVAVDGDMLSLENREGKAIEHRVARMPAIHLLAIAYHNRPPTDPRLAADAAAFLILDREDRKRNGHLRMAKRHYDLAVKLGLTDEAMKQEFARIPAEKLADRENPGAKPAAPDLPVVDKPMPEEPLPEKPTSEKPGAQRTPVPTTEALSDARKRSTDILKNALARSRTPESKQLLADELLKQAATEADLPMRYATLEKARDLMLMSSSLDVARAMAATEALAANFELDRFAEMQLTLAKATTLTGGKPELGEIHKFAAQGIEASVALRRYDAAAKLARVSVRAVKKANATELIEPAEVLADRLDRAASEQRRFESSKVSLERNPDDAAAHGVVGNFLAFIVGDFGGGLPHLVKGDNNELRLLAAADLGNPTEPAKQFALATEWHAQARRTSGPAALQMFKRAGDWSAKALPGLEGPSKEKAEIMVQEAAALNTDLAKP